MTEDQTLEGLKGVQAEDYVDLSTTFTHSKIFIMQFVWIKTEPVDLFIFCTHSLQLLNPVHLHDKPGALCH